MAGLGEISLDRVVRLGAWPVRGGRQTLSAAPMEQPGGQVATALLAANRLGLRARLLGSVGDDAAGGCALAPLRDAGIDLDGVRTVAGAPTRSALVLVDARDGERSVLGFRHPALDLSPTPSDRAAVRDARVLLVDASDPDAAHWAVGVAREKGAPSVLDVDAADPQRLALARSVDFPIVSREFSEQLSGGSSEMETLRCLAGSPVRMATVTRGPAGAIALLEAQVIAQPGFPVEVRDSTGAGDVFRGAFVWGLSRGGDARQVLAWSAAAASLSCRGFGAQGALPTAAEVERRVAAGAGSSAD